MRTKSTAFVLCLLLGGVAVGCADSSDTTGTRSAEQLLDEANRTMKALTSVTIVTDITTAFNGSSSRLTTDLKSKCRFKATRTRGYKLEQIRIGETDYIHPNDVYFEMWGRKTVAEMRQKPWLKSPVSAAMPADDLANCAWRYSSFGKATKGKTTVLNGKSVIPVSVAEEEVEGVYNEGDYTFYVAAEGKPYFLKVVQKSPHHKSTTEFSGFNEPLNIQPPAAADVLDLSSLPQKASS